MLYSGVGLITQLPDLWRLDDYEANTIAKPAARLLNHHPEWAEVVREKSGLVALIMALLIVTAPRVAMTKQARADLIAANLQAMHNAYAQPGPAQTVYPPGQGPQPSPGRDMSGAGNGRAHLVDLESFRSRYQG